MNYQMAICLITSLFFLSCSSIVESSTLSSQSFPGDHFFVAVDAGGTKTRVAVYRNGLDCIWDHTYSTTAHEQFGDILNKFYTDYNGPIHAAGLGLAGPVEGAQLGKQSCQLTNRQGWQVINSESVAKALHLAPDQVVLMNDLKATGYGIGCLSDDQFVILNEGVVRTGDSRAVVAPGTGLGNAALHWDGSQYQPYSSEGGHMNFAPRDAREIIWLNYIQERDMSSYVSIENAVSGRGICSLYQCLVEKLGYSGSDKITELLNAGDSTAICKAIIDAALNNEDPTAVEAVQWFVSLLATTAGSTTLYFCATGGCYLAGGLPARLSAYIEQHKELFMQAFIDKGPYEKLLANTPVKLVKNTDTAMIGAGYAAIDLYLKSLKKESVP